MNSIVLLALVATTPARFAVVVGVNTPVAPDVLPLAYADDDAVLTDRLLRNAGIDSRLLVDLDEDSAGLFAQAPIHAAPTPAAVMNAFEHAFRGIDAARAAGRPTELYFFYSGHGDVEHGEGYVSLRDGRLSRTDLYEKVLARSRADRNHIIVDACRSYFLVFRKGPGGRRAPHQIDILDAPARFPNTGFVLSTSSDRDSHEWARFRAGVFSHEVRSALYGGADVDRNGTISYAELGAFIRTANGAIVNPRFRPDAIVRAPRDEHDSRGSSVLAWSDHETRRLDVPPAASLGHVYLEDAIGIRLADAHPASGATLTLYVPTARPLFLRGVEVRREYAIDRASPVVLALNESQNASIGTKGAVHLAFRQLFDEPMSTAAVDRFAASAQIEVGVDYGRDEHTLTDDVRAVMPWVAGGAAAVGIGLNVSTVVLRSSAANGSQKSQSRANGRIDALNSTAIGAYAIATTAALTWLVLELF